MCERFPGADASGSGQRGSIATDLCGDVKDAPAAYAKPQAAFQETSMLRKILCLLALLHTPAVAQAQAEHQAELVFPLHPKHNHAPGIVELPNGDLLVSWYRGSGERQADDVAVYGARKKARSDQWGDAFLLADTPGFPDCNTALFIDSKSRL